MSLENKEIMESYDKIIIKGFKGIFNIINKQKNFKMSEIIQLLNNKNLLDNKMPIEQFNSIIFLSYIFAIQLGKEIDMEDYSYITFQNMTIDLMTKLENRTGVLTYSKFIKESSKENIERIENIVRRLLEYLDINKFNILDDIVYTFMEHEVLGKFTNVILNIIQTEDIDVDLITYQDYISPKDIKIITQIYYSFYQNQNREELSKVILVGLLFKAILKDYKKTKEYYFKNNKENLYIDIEEYKNKINNINNENDRNKLEIKRLNDELKRIKSKYKSSIEKENIKLKNENVKLKSQIEELEKDKEELNTLREVLFQSNEEVFGEQEIKEINIPPISALIVGGHENWQNKLKEKIPNTFKFLTANDENYDTLLLDNIDYVFFYTEYLNHAIYYKTINYCRKNNIKVGYINKTFIELTKRQIVKYLEKEEETNA